MADTDGSGNPANGFSYTPSVSADGRYVAFVSAGNYCVSDGLKGAANFAAGGANLITSLLSGGDVHVNQPFRGPGLRYSYMVGEWTTGIELALTCARGSQLTTLYRAVLPAEAADIKSAGMFRLIAGMGEGKGFFATLEEALNFAALVQKTGLAGDYSVAAGEIATGLLRVAESASAAGEGTFYFLRQELLQLIQSARILGPA